MDTQLKRGRPRFEQAAARQTITLTISAELRGALEAEATAASCSLSQIANAWLAKGRLLAAAERALLKFAET